MKKITKIFTLFAATTMLASCEWNSKDGLYSNLKSFTATIVNAPAKYYIGQEFKVEFEWEPSRYNYDLKFVVDSDGGTGVTCRNGDYSDVIKVNNVAFFSAVNPGTAKFHFEYAKKEKVRSDSFEITFVDTTVHVSTPEEFFTAVKENYKTSIIELDDDLDFAGFDGYNNIDTYGGTIHGNNHTIKNIDRLSTSKGDSLALFKDFYGTLSDIRFADCTLTAVAELDHLAVFADYSRGTIRNVAMDNIKIDSNLSVDLGALAGCVTAGNYENIVVTNGDIKGKEYTGGIFGVINASGNTTLKDIEFSGDVKLYFDTFKYVGGVASSATSSSSFNVTNVMGVKGSVGNSKYCSGGTFGFIKGANINFTKEMDNSELSVSGLENVGGLYGYTEDCDISNAVNKANVETLLSGSKVSTDTGGVVGFSKNSSFTRCKNYGTITVVSESEVLGVGGVIGTSDTTKDQCDFYYCENYGSIIGKKADCVGGICGKIVSSVNRVMGFAKVDCDSITAAQCCGAIIGYIEMDGTFSINSSSYKYNTCTYNKGHLSGDVTKFQPYIGGYASKGLFGTCKVQAVDITNLNN